MSPVLARLMLLGVAAAALAPAALIDAFPEGCLLARAGIDFCPGCGMTHALWWLLHGEAARALDTNPRVLLVAPLLAFVFARAALRANRREAPSNLIACGPRNPVSRSEHAMP